MAQATELVVSKDFKRLGVLRQKNADRTWVNRDLYRLMYKADLYWAAYERLKSSPGNMTPGADGSTLDGFSVKMIENIVNQMRDESFNFSRARRVQIPKAKGGTRPLGIAPPREKVVQEVMRMILECIYDSPHGPSFADSSHGFRSGRGCHTALKAIRNHWSGVNWIVEGDVKAAFDNIDHDILIGIMEERISDDRFLRLVRKALTAGYYEFRKPVNSVIGTPQGSVISPILCNIFLDKLDLFAEDLVRKHTTGQVKPRNPAYRSVEARLGWLRRKIGANPDAETKRGLVEELRERKKELTTLSPTVDDGSFVRVKYVRYADDFVIGVNGPRATAEEIRTEVGDFMRDHLALTLSLEKTHIRHAKTEEAFFLGTRVRIGSTSPKVRRQERDGATFKRRTAGWTPRMFAPVPALVKRLSSKGFCTVEGEPKAQRAWAVLDDDQIIHRYNSVLKGYLNYYSFADNYAALHRIQYILQMSAAKTLAVKHRTSARKQFKDRGRALKVKTVTSKGKELETVLKLESDWSRKPDRFLGGNGTFDPDQVILFQQTLRTRSKLGSPCAVCGSTEDVEMHHIRHVRKIGEHVKGFNRVLAAVNRKQIPVCSDCHDSIHNGSYDGKSLKDLAHPKLVAL